MYLVGDIVQYTPLKKKPVTVRITGVCDHEPDIYPIVYFIQLPDGKMCLVEHESLKPTKYPNWLDFDFH